MAERRLGLIAFLLCLSLCLLPCTAFAASTTDAKEPISTNRECALTICYNYIKISLSRAQGGLSVADGCRCLTKELDMIAC